MKGKLFIVSTPIGNLEDITLRSLNVLKKVDLIACEDTRITRKLLSHYDIKKPLTSYHEHNEKLKSQHLIKKLKSGINIALVSDAGTPGVSDPGYRIVSLASELNIEIVSIPGPSAVISALSVSGLPSNSFAFFGFLPRTEKKRKEKLYKLINYPETLIFYESPKRIIKTLNSILEVLGDRNISISRELTKIFEETIRDKISNAIEYLDKKNELKGEFAIVLEGNKAGEGEISTENLRMELKKYKARGLSLKQTVEDLVKILNVSKNRIYKEGLKIWHKNPR